MSHEATLAFIQDWTMIGPLVVHLVPQLDTTNTTSSKPRRLYLLIKLLLFVFEHLNEKSE